VAIPSSQEHYSPCDRYTSTYEKHLYSKLLFRNKSSLRMN